MGVFEDFGDTTTKASDLGERYFKTSRQYFKLKVFHQLTLSISIIAKILVIGGLCSLGLVYASIALAFYFSTLFDSYALGFLTVGAIYFILGILVYFFRSVINRKIIKIIGSKYFDNER